MKTVIKGAYYYDRNLDKILIPHFTGEFCIVDCTQYIKRDELKERYDEAFVNEVEDDFVEFEGEKYYYAEYSPQNVEDWELLSDISDLEHIEEEFDF